MLVWTLVLLLASHPKPPKAELTLYVSPVLAVRPAGAPVIVMAQGLSLKDPRKEWLCPEFTLDWGDDTGSTKYSGWCDPFSQDEETPTLWRMESRAHRYWMAGEWAVTLTVRVARRTMSKRVVVTVR